MYLRRWWILIGLAFWTSSVGAVQGPFEAVVQEEGQACLKYRYRPRDLAELRVTRLEFDALAGQYGKAIRRVSVESRDVFDESNPDENNWLYRALNRFHINTRPSVIASQLLFEEGDRLDKSLVRESERRLRRRSYLADAYILPDLVCQDFIDLTVVTRDSWTAEPQASLTREGGETRSGLGLREDNLLGTGDTVSVGYARDEDRSGTTYQYSSDHFLQTDLRAQVFYGARSDGRNQGLTFERPFYALDVPWAAGVRFRDVSADNTLRAGGEDINEFRRDQRDEAVYFGLAGHVSERYTRRWLVGVTRAEEVFGPTRHTGSLGVPDDRDDRYVWIGTQFVENKFAVYKNLNHIQIQEDVALGINYSARVGYGNRSLGNDRDLIHYRARYANAIGVGEHHILQLGGHLEGRHKEKDSGIAGVNLSYNWFRDDRNRWFVRLRYALGENLEQYEQLTLGGANGLRGYPIDFQRGERRYLFNLERRYFSDLHLFNLVRVGGAAYFDAGRAWGGDDHRVGGEDSMLYNVGVGLRLSTSKARVDSLVHIDLAVPLTQRQGIDSIQFLIKGESQF